MALAVQPQAVEICLFNGTQPLKPMSMPEGMNLEANGKLTFPQLALGFLDRQRGISALDVPEKRCCGLRE